MPVFRSGKGLAPAWCEMEFFEIVTLKEADGHVFDRIGAKEKLILAKGRCTIAWQGQRVVADGFANVDLFGPNGQFKVEDVTGDVELVRMCGRWGDEVGSSGVGVISVVTPDELVVCGTPVDYEKDTHFDNHYHDCDEYWIILEGRGTAVSEGKAFEVGPGDCIVTGMGHHHDFPKVAEPVRIAYIETTMEGAKRRGHLWDPRDGEALPVPERV